MKKRHIILLVEDNDDLRGMFRTALVVAGFHVQEAADGYDALRLLDEETPALVVLDLRLPLVDGRRSARGDASAAEARPRCHRDCFGRRTRWVRREVRHAKAGHPRKADRHSNELLV